jgi:ATP-dependent DNA helicase RecG
MIFGTESETLEFKKTTSETKDALHDVSAMLNKHGCGEVYFGVRNNGEVLGQTVTEKTLHDLSRAFKEHIEPRVVPTIDRVVIGEKACVRLAFEGDEAPYFSHGRAYIRSGEESLAMAPKELEEFFAKKRGVLSTWDSEPSDITLEDIDEALLRNYMQRANDCGRITWQFTSVEDVLKRLGLLRDGVLLNTAKVMFSADPDLAIQMATFAGEEKLTFIDIRQEKGTVLALIDKAERYIKDVMHWRVEFGHGLQRVEIPEVPLAAIKEALTNSFCHRLATKSQNNEVDIFSNRIEIYNPGRFPDNVAPEDFINGTVQAVQRNPLLAEILYYSNDIERFGTGLKRIHDACTEAGIPVKYEFRRGKLGLATVFYRPRDFNLDPVTGQVVSISSNTGAGANAPTNASVNASVNATQRQILDHIRVDASISYDLLAAALGKNRTTIMRSIQKLKRNGYIERKGSDKNGYWTILIPDNKKG